ncbi:5-formyltetrahydrofolate cyclo-ligase [Phytohabitans sp. ZYX-F-186]|uniref:5-formyltetrahydrofolate cyclo-ligase n=1 Tax=Phytohabitans maris TaxID=3071409 RepID=A0ABU0ZPY6_9ACTN|nr:5-formyltetrahydrofolate cyclo-ligase [Phytohabitans sp. ZYX-F-186]MDQ7909105.1 5-formyltetrahydrofolate cyclo-ligase [Phytohabitans sp. ZYX-F-186]
MSSQQAKQEIREQTWSLLERHNAVEPGVSGHIPAFVGADAAAARLTTLTAWSTAHTIKANPDRAQLPVRALALQGGKTVYMAVPNLATIRPFYLLDPATLPIPPTEAAAHQAAATFAPTIAVENVPGIDLIVCGSVAVNATGARIGKGAGYSDLELGLLADAGKIGTNTTIVTTVHPLQIIDRPIPETAHDFRVDAIITPETIITCPGSRRPAGILWDHLPEGKITAIPVLASRLQNRDDTGAKQRWS